MPARVTGCGTSRYLEHRDGAPLFSFDLPDRVFAQHAEREASTALVRPGLMPEDVS